MDWIRQAQGGVPVQCRLRGDFRTVDGGSRLCEKGSHGLHEVPAVEVTGGFADRVHSQLRYADIDRGYADFGGGQRTDGGAAGQVVAHHKLLTGNTGFLAEEAKQPCGKAIGSIPLVGVQFDDRSLVQ